jgi:hypothetical protein
MTDEPLRALIRDVLREVIREELGRALAEPGAPGLPPANSAGAQRGPGPATPATVHRVERGAVTERAVNAAAAAGAALSIGPRAVLTPLARDRARTLGVVIERT